MLEGDARDRNLGVNTLVDLIKSARETVVLTGAGISTASGIPDFRSPTTGMWRKMDSNLLSVDSLYGDTTVFYEHCLEIFPPMYEALPNPAHYALAALEQQGYISHIVTQNIDGLHQKAGANNVIEVHGHIRTVHCIKCQHSVPFSEFLKKLAEREIPPLCELCQGMIRPDVVLFGDQLPSAFQIAREVSADADLLLVVGSSLTVSPVNFLPTLAKKLAIINLTPTPYDHRAEVAVCAEAATILQNIQSQLI